MPDPLEKDLEKYKELQPTLAGSEGKFILIIDAASKGIFETYADALAAGYKEAGLKPFLVKQIAVTEYVAYFTRAFGDPCHT